MAWNEPKLSQQPRMRQFCVKIGPPYDWRNIEAALLREHSVHRICAHYKILQIFANLNLNFEFEFEFMQKKHAKNIWRMRKKKVPKKISGGIRTNEL